MTPHHSLAVLGPILSSLLVTAVSFAAPIHISEVLYDAAGSDDGRVFVELWGPAGTPLDGYALEGVNGSNGAVGPVLALSGAIPADGFFVVADALGGVSEVPEADLVLNFDFQNGPDSIVLRGPGGEAADALGYGAFQPGEVFAGEGAPAPDAAAGQSLARRFANADSDDNAADFEVLATPTPGSGVLVPEPGAGSLLGAALLGLVAIGCLRSFPPRVDP